MGLFGRKNATPAFGSETIKAASGSAAQVGQFFTYTVGATEELVTQLPTIQRGVQMITSVAGCLGFKHYTLQWTGEEYEKIYLELERWMVQPDPKVTRNFLLSNTTTDLALDFFTRRGGGTFFCVIALVPAPFLFLSTISSLRSFQYAKAQQAAEPVTSSVSCIALG